jgi:hypothetical protein
VVPSAVAQCITVKFLTNKNMKPAEILMRLGAQFSDKTVSRTQAYDYHLKEARQRFKICKDYTSCRESYGQHFLNSQGILFIYFLTEQQTINAAYYLKLLENQVKPAFCSKYKGD